MTHSKINYILVGLVCVVAGILIGLHFAKPRLQVGATTAGGTTSTASFFSVAVSMSGVATSSSVLNTSANDYVVTSIEIGCEGIGTAKSYITGSGIANLTLTVATSTTASPVTTNGNTNTVGGGTTNIATSTGTFVIASSTPSNAGSTNIGNLWLAGSYMTFYTNATTTGNCTFGLKGFSL